MEITGDVIKRGVKQAVVQGFPDATVYTERPGQGADRPYFFIRSVEVSSESAMNGRGKQSHLIEVRYHTEEKTKSRHGELDEVGSELMGVLKQIVLADGLPVRAVRPKYVTVDDVLVFTVTYVINTKPQNIEVPDMGTLSSKTHVRSVI